MLMATLVLSPCPLVASSSVLDFPHGFSVLYVWPLALLQSTDTLAHRSAPELHSLSRSARMGHTGTW